MKGFNLSKFKKVKEDKQWATLIHQDGHSLTIAKAPLSPIQRKQLENLAMHETPKMAEGGEINYDAIEGQNAAENAPYGTSPTMDSSPSADSVQVNIPGVTNASPAPSDQNTQAAPVQQQSPAAPNAPSQPATQSPFNSQISGFEEEKQANLEAAQAQGQQGQSEANAIQGVQDKINSLPSLQKLIADNQGKSDALLKAYQDQKVDPQRYWHDHSKVAAGIGLLLSGLGGNSGAAYNAINQGVQRDVEAQRNAQDQKMNLYKLNREALGNDLSANLATQAQLYTGLKYSIEKAAAQAKTPLALANAKAANARIDQQIGALNYKLALMNPTSDSPDPSSRVQFLVPEGRQAAVTKEIAEAQNTVKNLPGIVDAFFEAAKDSRPLTGGVNTSPSAFIPGHKTAGQSAFQARIAPTIQDQEGTVRQMAFENVDNNMTPAFGDNDSRIGSKLRSLIQYGQSKSSAPNSKSFGIDLAKYPTTDTRNIENYIKTKYPKEYQRYLGGGYERQVINGKAFMVPVK